MDLSVFFEPIIFEEEPIPKWEPFIPTYLDTFPHWQEADIILIGLGRPNQLHPYLGAWKIRHQLSRLSKPAESMRVVDLGNLKLTEDIESYPDVLTYVQKELLLAQKTVIWLGGEMDRLSPIGEGFDGITEALEYVSIGPRFHLATTPHQAGHHRELLRHAQVPLFNFTHLGHQAYYVHQAEKEFMDESHFLYYRYGELASKPQMAEPALRMAEMVHIDMASVQASVAGATELAPPSGFTASQICQLARYAGLGYQLRSLALTGYEPHMDQMSHTAKLGAMVTWYVIEGFYGRWDDYPEENRRNLRKYTVKLQGLVDEIRFYKHKRSQRWWMEVPYPDTLRKEKKGAKHTQLVPCDEQDYEIAKTDDIPPRWWATFHKLS
ncbi:MAG: arginase family protein [Bacteroidota bacterium]